MFCGQIHQGPVYRVPLRGCSVMPNIEFSWKEFDFGKCFVYRSGMPIKQCALQVKNADKKPIRCANCCKYKILVC